MLILDPNKRSWDKKWHFSQPIEVLFLKVGPPTSAHIWCNTMGRLDHPSVVSLQMLISCPKILRHANTFYSQLQFWFLKSSFSIPVKRNNTNLSLEQEQWQLWYRNKVCSPKASFSYRNGQSSVSFWQLCQFDAKTAFCSTIISMHFAAHFSVGLRRTVSLLGI